MREIMKRFTTTTQPEEGATAVEYALLVSLIAVAIIVAVRALGVSVSGIFQTVVNAVS
jgi:pilus assembly protein Flp/PilA